MKKIFSLSVAIALSLLSPRRAIAAPARVHMILWNGCEEACRGFIDYLQSVRLPVDITRRDLKKNTRDVPELIKEVKRIKPDLLVTWGTMATLEMLGTENGADGTRYGGMPALFMVVSQPVESGLVSSLSAQGRNITGVTHLPDLYEQLQSARRILPFKRLGVIYNPAETNARAAVSGLKKYADVMRFELIARPVPAGADGAPDEMSVPALVAELSEMKSDLIYLPPDAFMNAHRKALIDAATYFSIPVFSASEAAVRRDNALFAFVHRYYTVGRFAGKKAVSILKDKVQAYDIPIESPARALPVVNMTAARATGVYPPLSLLQNAELVNIPEKGN